MDNGQVICYKFDVKHNSKQIIVLPFCKIDFVTKTILIEP